MKYAICCYENGNVIDIFNTREEAVQALRDYEESDMDEGIYEAGFYEIKEFPRHTEHGTYVWEVE